MTTDAEYPRISELRIPPHSVDAEQSVLGGLMLANESWDHVAGVLTKDDFYRRDHRVLFEAISDLAARNEPFDVVTLREVLDKRGVTEDAGGAGYLIALAKDTPSAANIGSYARIVRDKAILRGVIDISNNAMSASYNQEEPQSVLSQAEQDLSKLRETRGTDIRPLKEYAPGYVDYLDDLRERGGEIIGTSTGLVDLDRATSGLQGGDLIILAARPSMGKTSLGLVIAEAVSREKPVAFFSMEMNERKILNRLASGVGHIPLAKFRQVAHWDKGDWPRLSDALVKVSNRPFYLEKTSGISPNALKASCRRVHRQNRLGLVVVDYLQLMRPDTRSQNRTQEVGEISHALKGLAEELDVPVICLSQLNRNLETRPNKRPIMADIRESGDVEQDADHIWFLYRDEVYNEDSPHRGVAELIRAKDRDGAIGTTELSWRGDYAWFANYEGPSRSEREPREDKPFQQRYRRSA